MIEIKGTEGLRCHLPLAYLTAPDSHLNGLHMAPLLCPPWVLRYAPLCLCMDPVTEAAEGTTDGELFGLRFHAAMTRPPCIVGASVYLPASIKVIRFYTIRCPAHLARMGIAPVLPELLALASLGRLRFLGFVLNGAARSTACGQLCTTISDRLELF